MRNCDYYRTPKELLNIFTAYCKEVEKHECFTCDGSDNECLLNFAYAEYDKHLLDKLILKPCPHCNGTAVLHGDEKEPDNYWVRCEECNIQTAFGTKDEVIEKWNRRTEK